MKYYVRISMDEITEKFKSDLLFEINSPDVMHYFVKIIKEISKKSEDVWLDTECYFDKFNEVRFRKSKMIGLRDDVLYLDPLDVKFYKNILRVKNNENETSFSVSLYTYIPVGVTAMFSDEYGMVGKDAVNHIKKMLLLSDIHADTPDINTSDKKETLQETTKRLVGLEKMEMTAECELHNKLIEKLGGEIKMNNRLSNVEEQIKELNRKIKMSENTVPGYESIPGIKEAVVISITDDIAAVILELQKVKDELVSETLFEVKNINVLSLNDRLELGKDIFGMIYIPRTQEYLHISKMHSEFVVINKSLNQVGTYDKDTSRAHVCYNAWHYVINIPVEYIDTNIMNKNESSNISPSRPMSFGEVVENSKVGFGIHQQFRPPQFVTSNPFSDIFRIKKSVADTSPAGSITFNGKQYYVSKMPQRVVGFNGSNLSVSELFHVSGVPTGYAVSDQGAVVQISYID